MDNLQSITISQCFTNKCYIYCIHIVLLYIDNCLCFYYALCIDDCQCLFYGLQNSHHPLLEVYAHDFRNNKSQKKTPAASDRCSTINYLFFIKTNSEFLNSNSPNWDLSINSLNFPLFSRLPAIENSIYVSFSLVFALMG